MSRSRGALLGCGMRTASDGQQAAPGLPRPHQELCFDAHVLLRNRVGFKAGAVRGARRSPCSPAAVRRAGWLRAPAPQGRAPARCPGRARRATGPRSRARPPAFEARRCQRSAAQAMGAPGMLACTWRARGGAPGPLGLPVAEELLTDSFLRRLFGRFFEAAAEAGARAAPIQARARRARPRPRPEMALPGAAPGTCPVFRAARGAWRAPALSQAHRAAEPPRLRGGRMRRPRECARPRAAPRPGGPRTHALPALRRRRRAVLGAAERRRLPSGRERLRPSPPLRLPEGTGRGRVHARESPALPSP